MSWETAFYNIAFVIILFTLFALVEKGVL